MIEGHVRGRDIGDLGLMKITQGVLFDRVSGACMFMWMVK